MAPNAARYRSPTYRQSGRQWRSSNGTDSGQACSAITLRVLSLRETVPSIATSGRRKACLSRSQLTSQTATGISPHSASSVRNTALANGRWRLTSLLATRTTPPSRRPCTVSLFSASGPSNGRANSITWPSGHSPSKAYPSGPLCPALHGNRRRHCRRGQGQLSPPHSGGVAGTHLPQRLPPECAAPTDCGNSSSPPNVFDVSLGSR